MSQKHQPFRRDAACVALAAAFSFLAFSGVASAQLTKAKDHRFVFGHLHVHPTSAEAHKKFWVEILGGTLAHVGTMEAAMYLDGLIEWVSPSFADSDPAGGTKSTTVDHVGFTVANVQEVVARVKAAGYPLVTRAELPPTSAAIEKDGIAFLANEERSVAFVMGPDDFLVELIEAKDQKAPIAMHHIHFATPQVADMEAWYVKLLGATRGKRGSVVESTIPGLHLTFSPSAAPVVGTKGRVLDHIGFEVQDLKAFTKELEEMGITVERFVETTLPLLGDISIAYLTDPWGTYIELSEGLDKVQ